MLIKLKYYGVSINNLPQNIELPVGSNIEKLIYVISDKIEYPINTLLKSSVLLVNKSKANKGTVLKHGDEVLFLCILGGG